MSLMSKARKSRGAAKSLYPAPAEVAAPSKHGRDAEEGRSSVASRGRLRYNSSPFYLKIPGLEGPRPPRFVERN